MSPLGGVAYMSNPASSKQVQTSFRLLSVSLLFNTIEYIAHVLDSPLVNYRWVCVWIDP